MWVNTLGTRYQWGSTAWFVWVETFETRCQERSAVRYPWMHLLGSTINWKVNGTLLLILLRRKVLNGLFEMVFDTRSTDATTNWNVEEGLLSKEDALFILFESAGTWISAMVLMLSLLNWFVLLKLRAQQSKGMAWNFWCWRYLDIYRKRSNPTSQCWTKIRMDSRERNAGRWETLWACQVQVCILICYGCC